VAKFKEYFPGAKQSLWTKVKDYKHLYSDGETSSSEECSYPDCDDPRKNVRKHYHLHPEQRRHIETQIREANKIAGKEIEKIADYKYQEYEENNEKHFNTELEKKKLHTITDNDRSKYRRTSFDSCGTVAINTAVNNVGQYHTTRESAPRIQGDYNELVQATHPRQRKSASAQLEPDFAYVPQDWSSQTYRPGAPQNDWNYNDWNDWNSYR